MLPPKECDGECFAWIHKDNIGDPIQPIGSDEEAFQELQTAHEELKEEIKKMKEENKELKRLQEIDKESQEEVDAMEDNLLKILAEAKIEDEHGDVWEEDFELRYYQVPDIVDRLITSLQTTTSYWTDKYEILKEESKKHASEGYSDEDYQEMTQNRDKLQEENEKLKEENKELNKDIKRVMKERNYLGDYEGGATSEEEDDEEEDDEEEEEVAIEELKEENKELKESVEHLTRFGVMIVSREGDEDDHLFASQLKADLFYEYSVKKEEEEETDIIEKIILFDAEDYDCSCDNEGTLQLSKLIKSCTFSSGD